MGGKPGPSRTERITDGIRGWYSDSVRFLAGIVLGLLIIQFLTGMGLSLFVMFPESPNTTFSDIFGAMMTGQLTVVHLAVGFLVSIFSVAVLAVLLDLGKSKLAKFAAVGLASTALAGLSGMAFVSSGFQNNAYSYLMAVGFIAAFTSYSVLLSSRANWS